MIKPPSKTTESIFVRGFKTRCENLSALIRNTMGLRESEPLASVRLAKYLGVYLWKLIEIPSLPKDTIRYLSSEEGNEWSAVAINVGNMDIVVLNPSHTAARQENDLMHELSHIMLKHRPYAITVAADSGVSFRTFDKTQEAEADWLAACLLLPRAAVTFCHGKGMSAEEAARHCGVSKELYTYRLRMTGVERQFQRSASSRSTPMSSI